MNKEMVINRLENRKKKLANYLAIAQEKIAENDFCGARCYLDYAKEATTEILTYESILESIAIWG